MNIRIIYATILGTSQMVSEDLEEDLASEHDVSISDIMNVGLEDLNDDALYVFVSSTTGHGDMPDSSLSFVKTLRESKPDLTNLNFAIFGLGDQGYADSFNMGSEKLCELLCEFGARQVGERGLFDASTGEMPEDLAIPWLRNILEAI